MAEVCLADKKKGFGDALLDLFVVREEGDAGKPAGAASPGGASEPPGAKSGDAAQAATEAAVVDDLIARYAKGEPAGKARATKPPRAAPPAATAAPEPTAQKSAVAPTATAATSAAAALPAANAVAEPTAPVPQIEIDTAAVLRKAGLSQEDQDRVEKTMTLLHTLPGDTPLPLKRQIVAASLQAFGIAVDQIVESALLHQGAFLRHQEEGDKQTQAQLQDSSRRLAELEKEAARIKQQMNEQRAQQQGLIYAVSRQKVRLQGILDFFGAEAVERAQKSSVKLRSGRPER